MASSRSHKSVARQHLWIWHWVMAACFLLLFVVGIYVADLPRGTPQRPLLLNLHKSFGVLVLGLLLIRVGLLLRVLVLKPQTASRHHRSWIWITVLHTGLYGFMLGVPLSGYAYSNFAGSDVPLFWLQMPPITAPNEASVDIGRTIHVWLAYSFLAFIGAHIIVQRKFLRGLWRRTARLFWNHRNP